MCKLKPLLEKWLSDAGTKYFVAGVQSAHSSLFAGTCESQKYFKNNFNLKISSECFILMEIALNKDFFKNVTYSFPSVIKCENVVFHIF